MAVNAAPAPGRKKSPLRSPVTWVIILGVTVAAGAYILWRRSQASAAASTSGTTAADTSGTDTSGATDYSAALGTLQTEIGDLQSSGTQSGTSSSGTGSSGTGSSGTGSSGTGTGSTGGTGSGGTGSSGGTKPGATAPKVPPVIGVINPGIGAVDISWTGVPSATGYELSITGPQGSAQASPKVPVTHARVQLPAGKKGMRVKVRGYNSAGSGPWSATRSFNVGGTAAKPAKKAG